jgi:hypothetical protein
MKRLSIDILKFLQLAFIGALFIALGCKRENPEYIAPLLEDIYGDFAILAPFTANSDTVNLVNGKPFFFNAKFNRPILWTITIRGMKSGMVNSLSNNSQEIDLSNSIWKGATNRPYGFNAEECEATLSFPSIPGLARTQRFSITAINPKPSMGIVIEDFEKGMRKTQRLINDNQESTTYLIDSIEGGKYLRYGGKDNNNSFHVAELQFDAADSVNFIDDKVFPIKSTDPNNVFFNVYVLGATGGGRLEFNFYENEKGDDFPGNQPQRDDSYTRSLDGIGNWTGWRVISIKYSDCAVGNNPRKNPNARNLPIGAGTRNPDRICRIGLKLISGRGGSRFQTIDHLTLTTGSPFTY